MHPVLSALLTFLYYLVLPIIWVVETLLVIILTILSPVLYLLQFVASVIALPFQIIASFVSFETLYNFLGVALIVGALSGISIYYFSTLIHPILNIARSPLSALETPDRSYSSYLRREQLKSRNIKPSRNNGVPPRSVQTSATSSPHPSLSLSDTNSPKQAANVTSRSIKSYRADRSARKAREASNRKLAQRFGVDPGILSALQTEGLEIGAAGPGGLRSAGSDVWSPSRDFGPPTPMMGTMILEEESGSDGF